MYWKMGGKTVDNKKVAPSQKSFNSSENIEEFIGVNKRWNLEEALRNVRGSELSEELEVEDLEIRHLELED